MSSARLVAFLCIASIVVACSADRLILSNYLNSPSHGKELAKVPSINGVSSYSGFFTVNSTFNSNLYFWLFPAQQGNSDSPLIIWLQGGPGASSLYGLFTENGPFIVSADGRTISENKYTWNKKYNIMYIDNPVGVGFSFTDSPSGYSVSTERDVADNMWTFLQQFYVIFPEFKSTPLFISGESYGGKYTPAIAYRIHENNKKHPQIHVPLKGLSIGDGAMDPITQMTGYSDLLYYTGFADDNERWQMKEIESQIVDQIGGGDFLGAFETFDKFLNGDFWPYPTYFFNITGITTYFNFLQPVYPNSGWGSWLIAPETRAALHVGDTPFWSYNQTVEYYLKYDWMRSISHAMPTLLENYKVLIYNGNLDLILGAPLTEKYIRTIPWNGRAEYLTSKKKIWTVPDPQTGAPTLAGYVKSVKNFRQVVVYKAGHMVPTDRPQQAADMITRFIDGKPF